MEDGAAVVELALLEAGLAERRSDALEEVRDILKNRLRWLDDDNQSDREHDSTTTNKNKDRTHNTRQARNDSTNHTTERT